MNKLLLLTLLISFNTSAIVLSPGLVIGFSDSSFNYDSEEEANEVKFCFWNDFKETCNEIKTAVYQINGGYSQGNHDKIELISCELEYGDSHSTEDKVLVSYSLSDDYGSEYSVSRVLKSCSLSPSL